MPAPDVAGYVDLRLLDADPQDLVDRALADATIKLPEWQPREGNVEVVLLEAMALQVAELTFAANRLPGTVTEVLLRLFGLERDLGAPPRFTVTLTTSNTGGAITVPAGTRFALDPGGGLPRLELTLDVDVDIAAAGTTTAPATATDSTDAANTLTAGTRLEVLDAVAYLESATAALLEAGRDPEDAPAFLDRGVLRLRRLVDTLVLPGHFTAAALEDVRVTRALTLDLYNPTAGTGAPGDHTGHVTVAVAGPAGTLLTADVRTELETTFEGQAHAGLDVHVVDVDLNTVDVAVTVVRRAGYTDADTTTAVTDALTGYLDPDAWQFGGTVYRNELIALVDNVAEVARVVDVTITGADADGNLPLTGYAPLADLGTATVTVQAP